MKIARRNEEGSHKKGERTICHKSALYTHIPQVEKVRSLAWHQLCGAEICTLSLYLLPSLSIFILVLTYMSFLKLTNVADIISVNT